VYASVWLDQSNMKKESIPARMSWRSS